MTGQSLVLPRQGLRLMGLLAGAALGIGLAIWAVDHAPEAEDAGLGIGTSSGVRAHALGDFEYDSTAALGLPDAMDARGLPRRGLLLGASQLYGINDRSPQDRTVGYRLFDRLSAQGVDLGVSGMANATAREHLILLAALIDRVKPEILVVGAVYDDMRHPEIRPDLLRQVTQPDTARLLAGSQAGRKLFAEASDFNALRPGDSPASPSNADRSWMRRSEAWINDRLEAWIGFQSFRAKGRAAILLTLADTRRFFESLRARWTRDLSAYRVPIPEPAYADNLLAWEALLALAADRGVETLVYIAPRPADFFPYDAAGYARFKADLRELSKATGAALVDIEDAVPPQHWGEVDITFGFPVRDPFHFKNEGHRLMADALLPHIEAMLMRKAAR